VADNPVNPGAGAGAGQSSPKRPRRRIWLRLLACGLFAYTAWCAVMYFLQDQILFPGAATRPNVFETPRDAADWRMDLAGGGSVEAWFFPAPSATSDHPAPAIIFFHGNGERIDMLAGVARTYVRLGCSVLVPEYRGYGRCAGAPSQRAIREDMVRWYDRLAERKDVDKARIVFIGHSLGGAVAADLSTQRRPAAMILQSALVSIVMMAHERFLPGFLVRNPFRTDLAIARLDCPLLLCHGTKDNLIPIRQARRLRALAPKATYIEYDCGHNDFPGSGNEEAYWREINAFLVKTGILPERSQ
jgi:pimeloyl-ACP methyl ester carboxylesterase